MAGSQLVTNALSDSAVTAPKIATDAVTNPKIAANAVDDTKLRLTSTGWLKSRNAANSGDLNVVRYNGIDKIEFADGFVFQNGGNIVVENEGPSGNFTLRTDNQTGVSTNSGDMVIESGNAAGATSDSGDVIIQTGTATQVRGNVALNGLNVNATAAGDINLAATDDIIATGDVLDASAMTMMHIPTAASDPTGTAEGQLYYNSTSNQMKYYDGSAWVALGTGSAADWEVETYTLSAGDITNQYIDAGFACVASSLEFKVRGYEPLFEGASYDYSVAPTGGAGGVARISFLNELASGGAQELVASQVVQIRYQKA